MRGYVDDPTIPAVGALSVAKLGTADLDRFYRHLLAVGGKRGPYKPASVRRVHGILCRPLAQGVRWGWLAHNPPIDASPPRVASSEVKPPTPSEIVRLYRAAQEWSPGLACFILLAASSGARRGELVARRWSDVDPGHGSLAIERGIVTVKGGLVEHGMSAEANAVVAGCELVHDAYIFSRAVDGSAPWRPDAATRDFRVVCERAGVNGVRLHDLRYYVATRLPASGIDVRTVAGRLGHRNPATTLDVYAHFVPEADQEAAEALGHIFEDALSPDFRSS